MKKLSLILTAAAALFLLSACRTVIVSPEDHSNVVDRRKTAGDEDRLTEQSVNYACAFVFGGDESHLPEVTDETPTEIKADMKDALMDLQIDLLGGERVVRSLSLDGVPAWMIVSDYADKVLDGLPTIKDYEVTDVNPIGDDVTVTLSLTPMQAVDSSLKETDRLRALKDFTVKSKEQTTSFTLQLDLGRYGVELDDDFFEDLMMHVLY
ncbi:hypothetical protein [Lactovum odontotermitis]